MFIFLFLPDLSVSITIYSHENLDQPTDRCVCGGKKLPKPWGRCIECNSDSILVSWTFVDKPIEHLSQIFIDSSIKSCKRFPIVV